MYRNLLIQQPFPPCCSKSRDDDRGHSCCWWTGLWPLLSVHLSSLLACFQASFLAERCRNGPSGRGFFISQPCMINWTSVRSETADPPSFPAVYPLYKQLITCNKWNALGVKTAFYETSRFHCLISLFAIIADVRCGFVFTGAQCLRKWPIKCTRLYRMPFSFLSRVTHLASCPPVVSL